MFQFKKTPFLFECEPKDWFNWKWQLKNSLKTYEDFSKYFNLTDDEKEGFKKGEFIFKFQITPFFASLACENNSPLRQVFLPSVKELEEKTQSLRDPLGEDDFSPKPRIIHRYPDRVLFLVTDFCGIYCRYCTRKYFTGKDHFRISSKEYEQALDYISKNSGIREVILSGGDPLSLSDDILETYLSDLRKIPHIEIIRIGTRFISVNPMRITENFVNTLKKFQPVYLMVHINHPKEITHEVKEALSLCVDNGIPVLNQMVLIKGYNNHAYILQSLFRRLIFLRVKPYYMFQCDPSLGTSHLKTSLNETLKIQRELWGALSGICLPQLSLDIPGGGGKVGLVPNFLTHQENENYFFQGWDGKKGVYQSAKEDSQLPEDFKDYETEWETIKNQKYGS